MIDSENESIQFLRTAISRIRDDMIQYHPRALVLFGSMARFLSGIPCDQTPGDLDLLMIGDNAPYIVRKKDYGCPVELHRLKIYQVEGIARLLRYDAKPIALSKLYGDVVARQHSIKVILASMLLGPSYNDFGIEQIDKNGRPDTRDYSIHQVIMGEKWWESLVRYSIDRRGPLKRFSDKIVGADRFRP